mgnify:FL=1
MALAFLIDDHADNRPAFEYGMGYLLVYKDLMTFMHYMELMKELYCTSARQIKRKA